MTEKKLTISFNGIEIPPEHWISEPTIYQVASHDPIHGDNGRWVWIPDDDRPDPPHDDHRDHDPCPSCNPKGKGKTPGWYHPLTGPAEHCRDCEGAGWL